MPRLDTELVRRGLARSRTHAARMITAERVAVLGRLVTKPAAQVTPDDAIGIAPARGAGRAGGPSGATDWASRGAWKLTGALDTWQIDVTGRRALDAGASTGGFTDVLLERGAAPIAAVDVGAGQLDPRLAADPRVHVLDRTNIRELAPAAVRRLHTALGGPAQIVVADLSFISLTLVLPALIACADPDGDLLPMVKPQFEVGKGRLGAHGVVRDPALRAEAVTRVAEAAALLGWGLAGATASSLPGPAGNVEYFLHLRADAPRDAAQRQTLVGDAVEKGPA